MTYPDRINLRSYTRLTVWQRMQSTVAGRRTARLWDRLRYYMSAYSGYDVSLVRADAELAGLVQVSLDANTPNEKLRALDAVLSYVSVKHGITVDVLDAVDSWTMVQFYQNIRITTGAEVAN